MAALPQVKPILMSHQEDVRYLVAKPALFGVLAQVVASLTKKTYCTKATVQKHPYKRERKEMISTPWIFIKKDVFEIIN